LEEVKPDKIKKNKPPEWKLKQFKLDVALLIAEGHTQTSIAKKMGWKKGNFNRYHNNPELITENFLTKFYNAWGMEIKLIMEKQEPAHPEPLPDTMAQEEAQTYVKSLLDHIETLKKTNDSLQKKNNSLQKNLDQVIAINQKLTDALISLGTSPGGAAEGAGEMGKG